MGKESAQGRGSSSPEETPGLQGPSFKEERLRRSKARRDAKKRSGNGGDNVPKKRKGPGDMTITPEEYARIQEKVQGQPPPEGSSDKKSAKETKLYIKGQPAASLLRRHVRGAKRPTGSN